MNVKHTHYPNRTENFNGMKHCVAIDSPTDDRIHAVRFGNTAKIAYRSAWQEYRMQSNISMELLVQYGPAPRPAQKKVAVPKCVEHGGVHKIEITLDWVCPKCGGPRGEPYRTLSFDGSRRLGCDGWINPCGHIDTYSDVRKEAGNTDPDPTIIFPPPTEEDTQPTPVIKLSAAEWTARYLAQQPRITTARYEQSWETDNTHQGVEYEGPSLQ